MLPPADRFGFPDFTGRTILVVEDNQDGLDFLTELLRFCGADVLRAPSTAHARAHLHTRSPDLIVCDFQMQRETGVDFMRWLRLHHDHHTSVPAIAVTAHPQDLLKERDVAHAFDAYFEKPIHAPRFLGIAEALLLKPQPARPLRDRKTA